MKHLYWCLSFTICFWARLKDVFFLQCYIFFLGSPWILPSELPIYKSLDLPLLRCYQVFFGRVWERSSCRDCSYLFQMPDWWCLHADILIPFKRVEWTSMMWWAIWLYFWGENLSGLWKCHIWSFVGLGKAVRLVWVNAVVQIACSKLIAKASGTLQCRWSLLHDVRHLLVLVSHPAPVRCFQSCKSSFKEPV